MEEDNATEGKENLTDPWGNGLSWNVNSGGCLSIEGSDKSGTVKVYVSKQNLRDRVPERRAPLRKILGVTVCLLGQDKRYVSGHACSRAEFETIMLIVDIEGTVES